MPTSSDEMDLLKYEIDHIFSNVKVKITSMDVVKAVKSLKLGKSDGDNGIVSDHIICGSNRLYIILSILLKCMFVHSHTPQNMLSSVIIPIPKNLRGNLTCSDNYRGISLCSSLCKLIDIIIIDICSDNLVTSDLQFAYKKYHSTSMCTSVMKEVVSHYITRGSNVY